MSQSIIGARVVINTKPFRREDGNVYGFKEGCGEEGRIVEYDAVDECYTIDVGGYLGELYFTREHFDIIE